MVVLCFVKETESERSTYSKKAECSNFQKTIYLPDSNNNPWSAVKLLVVFYLLAFVIGKRKKQRSR